MELYLIPVIAAAMCFIVGLWLTLEERDGGR
jgi:hypothetical protein